MHIAILHDSKLSEMEAHLEDMKRALRREDMEQYHKARYLFHESICRASRNPLYIMLYTALTDCFFSLYKTNSETAWSFSSKEDSLLHHQQIMEALRMRNLEACLRMQNELLGEIVPREWKRNKTWKYCVP